MYESDDKLRLGVKSYAVSMWDENLVLRFRSAEERSVIADVATDVFLTEVGKTSERPTLRVYKSLVRAELQRKQFIPAFIIWIVVEFLIWKFLEWLWNNWKGNPSNPDSSKCSQPS